MHAHTFCISRSIILSAYGMKITTKAISQPLHVQFILNTLETTIKLSICIKSLLYYRTPHIIHPKYLILYVLCGRTFISYPLYSQKYIVHQNIYSALRRVSQWMVRSDGRIVLIYMSIWGTFSYT